MKHKGKVKTVVSAAGKSKTQSSIQKCWIKATTIKDHPSSKSPEPKSHALPVCPLCGMNLWEDNSLNNLHIDSCLNKQDKRKEVIGIESILTKPIPTWETSHGTVTGVDCKIVTFDALPGLILIPEFVSRQEELTIVQSLHADTISPWRHSSFNGHCNSKCFGVRTQFGLPDEQRLVRQNDINLGEQDIPLYLCPFTERLQAMASCRKDLPSEVRDFKPNDCNANHYIRAKGHYLRPHFDDRALSGPLLVNLSLEGTVRMTYSKPNVPSSTVAVTLPPRCLQLVTGLARWLYTHEIKKEDVLSESRLSVTWRQSGGKKKIAEKGAPPGGDISAKLSRQQADISSVPMGMITDHHPVKSNAGSSSYGGNGCAGINSTSINRSRNSSGGDGIEQSNEA